MTKYLNILFYVIIISICLNNKSYSFNEEDLQKLLDTNICIKCDLSGADLRKKDLSGANLKIVIAFIYK